MNDCPIGIFSDAYGAIFIIPSRLIKRKHFKKLLETTPVYNVVINNTKEVMTMSTNDQKFLVQKIRSQYTEKQHTELDALKELDAKVKRPANLFAYIFGSIGAVVMGAGMSLVMTDIGATIGLTNATVPGVVIGVAGLAMVLCTYPIYRKILNKRKKKIRF